MFCLTSLFLIIMVLVSVGFFTLLERKVLSYMQIRKGPNKVGYMGLLQPFSDGMKLFMSEQIFPLNSNYFFYFVCPFMSLIQSLFIWMIFPFYINCVSFEFGFLVFLCVSSIGVYFIMLCGWSSNSMYSMLGCIRSISQTISYEVSLSTVMLCYFLLVESYNFVDFYMFQVNCWFMYFSIPLFYSWVSCCMAETNRAPFDFSEGESELVSGFNVEYGGGFFSVLFIAEYLSIIFISLLTCMLFLGGNYFSFTFFLKLIFMCFLFIWIRCSFPRYRYDKLMYLAWKCYLPMTLNYLIMFIFIKVTLFYHFFLLS
uniref:NADH dehydrogenase subunit 1 n=1 Tax=Pediopsoides anchorides TaxID=3035251 RepID=UPI00241103C0|nr:NADH dehydrogenase subunit 1 [Pediopsoides anchorides]WEP24783.1 NADH dehydrogenase subunit 1 [Pediopsoides anchorides]